MQFIQNEIYFGFRLLEERVINEIQGVGRWFKHEKSGVTLFSLENKDPHKVFSVSFMTKPDNSLGAAHIVEHTVCCASHKYPLKETFMAASQGSICTTMNACTYPDHTMYYVASGHEKDLLGMAEVFLDMVFHPCIEQDNQYFLQEGWRYIYDKDKDLLDFSGVVYHEMLGEYSEATNYLRLYELETLFPNTCYQYDSGGLPEYIPCLSEEAFLAFYRKFYVGSNATITLYGDMNLEEALHYLDEKALQDVQKGEKSLPPKIEKPFAKPQYTVGYYPSKLKHSPTLVSIGFVVGKATDCEQRLAMEMLEHMLIRSAASPLLKQLVLEEQLGLGFGEGGLDSCRQQPVFSITLKGASKEKALLFESRTLEILQDLVHKGIDSALIDAAIESLEFELRETDASYEPIGIVYSEMIMGSFLYGGDPFSHLSYQIALDHIKANCHKGYFEKWIQEAFLDNPHRCLTLVMPSHKMQEEREKNKKAYLEEKKRQLGTIGLNQIVSINHHLKKLQLMENDEVSVQRLPQLAISDMPLQLENWKSQEIDIEGTPVLYHIEETKDILYFHFLWEAAGFTQEERQDLGLLAHVFSYVGTKDKEFSEIENRIQTLTGGFRSAVHAYTKYDTQQILPTYKISCKVLWEHLDSFMTLMLELLKETHFEEKEKLRELIGQIVYDMEQSFSSAPEYRGTQRVYTYLCGQGVYEDDVEGIAFYHYIKEIHNQFDRVYESLNKRLMKVMQEVFKRGRLKLAVTAPHRYQSQILQSIQHFLMHLDSSDIFSHEDQQLVCYKGNEFFINGQEGHAIAMGINFINEGYSYRGQYEVVVSVLENTYLWDRVRLQGGAYGCDILLSQEGHLIVCSYCDPNFIRTLNVFKKIGNYLRKIQLSQEAIQRAIVSTLGVFVAPCSIEQKSERACTYFITGMPQSKRQQVYDEIRQTTLQDFRDMGQLFEALGKNGVICAFGDRRKLHTNKNSFELIDLQI